MSINLKHLEQVEETYFQHFCFALKAGVILIVLGVTSIIHAVIPFVFARTPDKIYRYFLKTCGGRIKRVSELLKEKGLE